MTINQQTSLIEYGASIDVKVTPIESCGVLGVQYMDSHEVFSFERAHHDLDIQRMSLQRCAA